MSWIEPTIAAAASVEDKARAVSRATAERYRRMAIPGLPVAAWQPEVIAV
ncbi:hypothetical protein FHT00_003075 [Sphingomonas insulae]|nr:hypothetical protein [Sphingomonas insulae]